MKRICALRDAPVSCAAGFHWWLDASGLLDEADAQRPLDVHLARPTALHA